MSHQCWVDSDEFSGGGPNTHYACSLLLPSWSRMRIKLLLVGICCVPFGTKGLSSWSRSRNQLTSTSKVNSWQRCQQPFHPTTTMKKSLALPTVLMGAQAPGGKGKSVTQQMTNIPGLLWTLARHLLSKGLRFSTATTAVAIVPETSRCASPKIFQPRPVRSFLEVPCSAPSLDLALTGNI